MKTLFERFISRVNYDGPIHPKLGTRCWLWLGHCNVHTGYGAIGVGSKTDGTNRIETTHRVAWELSHGPVPDGLQVLHVCDVRPCIRPSHLFIGTQAENMADMDAKGRRVVVRGHHVNVGSAHGMSKLTECTAKEIKALLASGLTQKAIADLIGIGQSTISRINTGKRWAHVTRSENS